MTFRLLYIWEVAAVRKILLLSVLTVLLSTFYVYAGVTDCSAPPASLLNIKNSTGIDIRAIHIAQSGSGAPEWSKNLLEPEVPLKNGATAPLPMERETYALNWTIKTVDTRGRETLHEKLPLSFIFDIELKPEGKIKYQVIYDT